MKKVLLALSMAMVSASSFASIETRDWHNTASAKAQKFVKENLAIDFYASPHKTGWDNNVEVANYIDLAFSRGIDGASVTLGSPATPNWAKFVAEHKAWTEAAHSANTPIRFVNKPEDFKLAYKNGQYAVQWNSQSTMMLEGDVSKVKEMAAMGIKTMQLTYNETEKTGVGVISMINGDKSGLTKFGEQVIDEMVKYGITVDLSHTSYQTTMDIMNYMEKNHKGIPPIFSHSPVASTYGCQPHETLTETQKRMAKNGFQKGHPDFRLAACYRLLSDEQVKKVVSLGGIVAITGAEFMLDGIWPEDITPKQYAEMVDGAVKVAGIDHVGIGTDDLMTTSKVVPFTIANADKYADNGYMVNAFNLGATGCAELSKHLAAVTDELWKMGYSDEDLRKLYGENLVRVYKQTWK
ncbi:membrane dipeptidase [Catenovulum sp. SM1970]|uniref:dipeptidase n=1 Tax=Marinifaba aquimaris TaxID=2741323 RepID=UPI001573B358|nr:membrane dipeptidase [Marinifaba aquimaris]NTS76231.1 membrane dipeptidase [Marinifaba aquimaris]